MVRCGIAGWVDKELIASKKFYPHGSSSSADRLHFYASRFPLVEVDSSYYGMPAKRNSELWIARTPPSFPAEPCSWSAPASQAPRSLKTCTWRDARCTSQSGTPRASPGSTGART